MDCFYLLLRLASFLSLISQLIGCLMAVGTVRSAHADQLEQHQARVTRFIVEQQANPLAADCAAHASFVVPTSRLYSRMEFTRHALDNTHVLIVPWHGAFGNGQQVEVNTIVKIAGVGYRKSGAPDVLTIRCGYRQNKMLAFDYNGPQQPMRVKKRKKGRRAQREI